jgi:hypothetical protein
VAIRSDGSGGAFGGDARSLPSVISARGQSRAGAGDSHGRLLLLGTKSVQAATHRIAQLVGGSTSRAGQRIIACSGAFHRNVEAYREGAIAVALAMCGDDDADIQDAESRMLDQGVPTVSIKLQTPADIGGSILVWEVATALPCSLLGVNPIASPNRRCGSNRSLAIVENLAARCALPALRPRALEKGLQLYAEGETRLQISTLNFSEALRTFFELRPPTVIWPLFPSSMATIPKHRTCLRVCGMRSHPRWRCLSS